MAKDSPRIEACGSLDELSSLLGIVRTHRLPESVDRVLQLAQECLFTISAELATPEGIEQRARRIGDEEVRRLEKEIDAFEIKLPPLKRFILPGGARAGAELHLARAVARRAERICVTLSRLERVRPQILRFLNRLSDLCFVLARDVNRRQSVPERHPTLGRSGT